MEDFMKIRSISMFTVLLTMSMSQAAFAMEKLNADLRDAAYLGDIGIAMAEEALKQGADINCTDTMGRTPLHWACHSGPAIVKLLLDYGASSNCVDRDGNIPLFLYIASTCSFKESKQEKVKLLLNSGADINWTNDDGKTALDIAKEQGCDDIIKLITDEAERRKVQELQEYYAKIILKRLLARESDITIANLLSLKRK
jgi:ankyrin repeat protein